MTGSNSFCESLFVFYPISERPNVIQTKLSQACPGADIIVFGRIQDFISKTQESPPDAILSKPTTLQIFDNYTVQLKGTRKGNTEETYVLVSVEKGVDVSNLANSTIGMIDILGRKEMIKFIQDFLPSTPKLKRVTKMEDLLPLLIFNMCNAILITENSVHYFKSISKLNFVNTPIPSMKTGIITLAVKNDIKGDQIINKVKNMGSDINSLLEVDSWK